MGQESSSGEAFSLFSFLRRTREFLRRALRRDETQIDRRVSIARSALIACLRSDEASPSCSVVAARPFRTRELRTCLYMVDRSIDRSASRVDIIFRYNICKIHERK